MTKIAKSLLGGSVALGLFGAVAPQADAALAYAVTETNTLISFRTDAPGEILAGVFIDGLANNETVVGIDFRPASLGGTPQLYALGSSSRLYQIDVATGTVTQVGTRLSPLLDGSSFGFDFNPTVDRIRVVSNTDRNFRLHPDAGVGAVPPNPHVASDTTLNYVAGGPLDANVVSSAYTNNFAGATSTTLYGIDSITNSLVLQGGFNGVPSPNGGQLTLVGTGLGFDVTDRGGFDIITTNGVDEAFAVLTLVTSGNPESQSGLYRINLTTGTASIVGPISGGEYIRAFAIVPEPASLGLIAAGAMLLAGRRRRNA